MRYAKETTVPPEKSRMEIEATVTKYGATQFLSGWSEDKAVIGFTMRGKMVKFYLPIPDKTDKKYRYTETGRWRTPSQRSDNAALQAWEQDVRQRWRALALVVKAKLEAVESGITTFEEEFLAHIVLPDGNTVGQWMTPQLSQIYTTAKMPALLPGIGETSGPSED